MNYLQELNAFYGRLMIRPLSANAIALWGVLMHLANRADWPHEFSVPASTLCGILGFSERTMRRARAELVEAGLIRHIERPGRMAPIYVLLSTAAKLQLVRK